MGFLKKLLNFPLYKLLVLFAFYLFNIIFCNAKDLPSTIDSLWRAYPIQEKINEKVSILNKIQQCYDFLGEKRYRDSVLFVELDLVPNIKNTNEKAIVFKNCIETMIENGSEPTLNYIEKYRAIIASMHNQYWDLEFEYASAGNYFTTGNYDDATKICKKIIENSIVAETELETRTYFLLAKIFDAKGNKLESFRNYSHALLCAQQSDNKQLEINVTGALAKFFDLIDNTQMAEYYLKKQSRLVVASAPIDSYLLINNYKTLAYVYFMQNNPQSGEIYWNQVIEYAVRNNIRELKSQALTDYRSYLIQNNLYRELYNLYNVRFPSELKLIQKTDTALYFRLAAYMNEGVGNIDSAIYYFSLCEKKLKQLKKDKIFMSNFYKRYGELLIRKGNLADAKEKLETAMLLAEEKKYYPYLVDLTHYLDSIAVLQNDIQNAYKYSKLNTRYFDSFINTSKGNELNQLEINNEESQLVSNQEREKLKISSRHRLQMVSLSMGLLIIVITAIYVFVNYRKQKKFNSLLNIANEQLNEEKQKSEDLLLNVLPAKVADELKEKGFAEARHFTNVSVLFTDFKGFTLISERLTPQELVNELHECFKGFDEIVTKYGVEKIKTVGDAYLAVCGLPSPNPNHAENIINAAIEIRDFMIARKKYLGELTFGIRLGIHSGEVVAGIVGVKKFAYDIWGDTVNTAARMEQNSEAGKVNISENTFQLAKDKFDCQYRGEIQAKNKGALKMYFVEQVK